jgi:hypothetical protein
MQAAEKKISAQNSSGDGALGRGGRGKRKIYCKELYRGADKSLAPTYFLMYFI